MVFLLIEEGEGVGPREGNLWSPLAADHIGEDLPSEEGPSGYQESIIPHFEVETIHRNAGL
jgi:hypothetical protein